jgi:hypothetical protein
MRTRGDAHHPTTVGTAPLLNVDDRVTHLHHPARNRYLGLLLHPIDHVAMRARPLPMDPDGSTLILGNLLLSFWTTSGRGFGSRIVLLFTYGLFFHRCFAIKFVFDFEGIP